MSEGIKIAFVLSEYGLPIPAKKGGAIETLMTMLLEQNSVEGKYEFIFISPREKEEREDFAHAVCYGILPYIKTGRKAPVFWQKVQYKLNQYFPGRFVKVSKYYKKAYHIAKQNNADYVIGEGILHDQFARFLTGWGRERLAAHIHHQCQRTVLCDKIFGKTIAISKYIADKWNESMPEKARDTFVLKNCVDVNRFDTLLSPEQRLQIREEAGFCKNDFVVLFCGRIVPEKGVRELIDAVTGIQDPRVKLLIIGSDSFARGNMGQYAEDIKKSVAENKERVVYAGYIDNSLLYQYYQSADVQLVPSIWEEPAGLVTLEGMLSRLPLIVTRSGGMTEFVNPEYTRIIPKDEYLVENIREQIEALADNPEERRRMAEGAYEWAKQFSKQRYYAEFCNIMTEWRREVEKNNLG